MAGLFGGINASGAEDELRRRRGAPGATGYEGIGGAQVLPGMMLPYLTGARTWDYSGPMGQDFAQGPGQGGGLAALLAHVQGQGANDLRGPALRHFANQGFDFMPPGLENQNGIGGPNIAPGNIDTGEALDQPMGNPSPGVPRGVAGGVPPGQVGPPPHTQGWRNYAPGYSAAAALGYGTPEFGGHFAQGTPMPPGALGAGGAPEAAKGGQGGGRGLADLAGLSGGPGAPQGRSPAVGGGRGVSPTAARTTGGPAGGQRGGGKPAVEGGTGPTTAGGRGGGGMNANYAEPPKQPVGQAGRGGKPGAPTQGQVNAQERRDKAAREARQSERAQDKGKAAEQAARANTANQAAQEETNARAGRTQQRQARRQTQQLSSTNRQASGRM